MQNNYLESKPRDQMAIFRVYIEGGFYTAIECESFQVDNHNRLNLESYNEDCEPICVAVFDKWEFCIREDLIKLTKESKRPESGQ